MLTFTKKGNDSITMKRTKIVKWFYYYGTEEEMVQFLLRLKMKRNRKTLL